MKTNNVPANKVKNDIDDKKISIALMATFVILTAQYFLLINLNMLGSSDANQIQLISKISVGIAFLVAFPAILRRSKIKLIVTYILAGFIFLFNYLAYPDNTQYLNELVFPFFFMCLPAFIYTISISNWSILSKVTKKASLIIFFIGSIIGMQIFLGVVSVGSYSMSLSYYMLLPALLYLDELLDRFSLKALLCVLISIIIILSLGSRGAMLCISIFLLLKIIRLNFRIKYSKIPYYIFSLFIIIVMVVFYQQILEYFYNLLLSYGIRSRSILLFLSDEVHLSGRDYIYHMVMLEITNSPITGLGLGGDRQVIGGGYAHNFIIEVLSNFGIILGSLLLVLFLILIIKSLIINNIENYNVIITWLSIGLVHLMVSSSYLIDMKFWIFLGLLVSNQFLLKKNVI